MKLRSFFYALTALVLVLLLVGTGGFYWLTSQSPLALLRNGSSPSPTAAMFVSKQAPIMVSVLVNPSRLEAFRQLVAAPGERRQARLELHQLKQSILAETNLDYRRDIQPWVDDEITVAIMSPDFDRNSQNGLQPGYLLAVKTKDANRSRDFIELFWQKQASIGADLVFEQYKGVKLIYSNNLPKNVPTPPKPDTPTRPYNSLASAIVGNQFVLFANNPRVLRDAINNVQAANLNLRDSTNYQMALQNMTEPRIALTFVNLPAISVENEQAAAQRRYQSLVISLGLHPEGLLAEASLIAAPDQKITATPPALSAPVSALQYIPASSKLVAASTNLEGLWQHLSATPSTTLQQLLEVAVASLQKSWGIQLTQDIFSWVQGEYALGMLPGSSDIKPDWIFVAEKSPTAQASIEHLDAVAQQQGLSVSSLQMENHSVTAWAKLTTMLTNNKNQTPFALEAQVQGVHVPVGKYEIFASSASAINQALNAGENSVLKSPEFKSAIAPLPTPNDGYLYIDWAFTEPILGRKLPIFQLVELVGSPLLDHLRSLTVSSYGNDSNVQRSKVFLRLGTHLPYLK